MKKFHIRSMLLGMGIGIILTSFISMIYLAGYDPARDMTREEIIKQAKKHGIDVIEPGASPTAAPFISMSGTKETPSPLKGTSEPKEAPAVSSVITDPLETPVISSPTPGIQNVVFEVRKGEYSDAVAQGLQKAGLIQDPEAFKELLSDLKLSTRIQIGRYEIPEGTDMETIAMIITNSGQ